MQYDVVIVGAGPSGLCAAIRLKQLSQQVGRDLSVCILEKGSQVGSHILSGAVLEPRALDQLLPDWLSLEGLVQTSVKNDKFFFLTQQHAFRLPLPPQMSNRGNFIISLGQLCRCLGKYAEDLGVEIFPGFAATECLFDESGRVCGVHIGAMGLDNQRHKTSNFQPGVKIFSQMTLLAEGCRGSLTRQLFERFKLDKKCNPQTYGLGIKELWEVDPEKSRPGNVLHSIGWPLDKRTYGGGFFYHMHSNYVSLGFVVGLDYSNPTRSPFGDFQLFKSHPMVCSLLRGGKRLGYGARALNEGGSQSIPSLEFPGGSLIGCAAGFMNVPKIKGIHTAMKSGMIVAEATFDHLVHKKTYNYQQRIERSWVYDELFKVRNIRPAFRSGLWTGVLNAAFETYITRGKSPWTLKNRSDYLATTSLKKCKQIDYPIPDRQVTFDRLSSIYLSNINHRDSQPNHLKLQDPTLAIKVNYEIYGSPEQYYCPAKVYEIVFKEGAPTLQINAQNCIHCKACDIKDPRQNIIWTPPEGGSGPNYEGM